MNLTNKDAKSLKNVIFFLKPAFRLPIYTSHLYAEFRLTFLEKSYFGCRKVVDLEWTPVVTLEQEQQIFSGKGSGETYEDTGSQ